MLVASSTFQGATIASLGALSDNDDRPQNSFPRPTSGGQTPESDWLGGADPHLAHSSVGSLVYSFEADTLLSVDHHMAGMGYPPIPQTTSLSDNDLKSLIGEAFAAPCIGSLVVAFVLNPFAPWWVKEVLD